MNLRRVFYFHLVLVNFCISSLKIMPKPDTSNSVHAFFNESFMLSCNGNDASQLEWGNQSALSIRSLNAVRLFFDKIDFSHSGLYSCSDNTTSTSVNLTVFKRIEFYQTPLNQFISSLNRLVVCNATSIPMPEIVWFLNRVKLYTDSKYEISAAGLVIKNIEPSDENVYTCQASVPTTGHVKTLKINVTVMKEPSWYMRPLETIEATNGQELVIKCAAYGKPTPTYQWFKQEHALYNGEKFKINGSDLILNYLSKHDSDDYKCIAKNPLGSLEARFRVNVLSLPQIDSMPNEIHVKRNERNVIIRCKTSDLSSISWKEKNELINENNYIKISQCQNWSEIQIYRITLNTNFTCVAKNKVGSAERTVQVYVTLDKKDYIEIILLVSLTFILLCLGVLLVLVLKCNCLAKN
jgi:hypothetical protein